MEVATVLAAKSKREDLLEVGVARAPGRPGWCQELPEILSGTILGPSGDDLGMILVRKNNQGQWISIHMKTDEVAAGVLGFTLYSLVNVWIRKHPRDWKWRPRLDLDRQHVDAVHVNYYCVQLND